MISLRLKYDIAQAFERHVRSLRGRVRGLATRFVLGKASRAESDLARVRGETFSGDASDADELMQNYGFASVPLPGAEGVRISVFADGDHGVVVALDDRRHRPTLADGETAQYNDTGAIVHIKADGSINLVPTRSGLVHLGSYAGTGFVALAHLVLAQLEAIKTKYDSHTHTYLPGPGASTPTGPPVPELDTPQSPAASKVKGT